MVVDEWMDELARSYPEFDNERDFQFRLRELLEKITAKRVPVEHQPGNTGRERIDLVSSEKFIELKYRHAKRGDKPNGKYAFLKDIKKLEDYCEQGLCREGIAILITRDGSFWEKSGKNLKYPDFELYEGRVIKGKVKSPTDRYKEIQLTGKYTMHWRPYGTEGFYYLAVTIN